MSPVDPPTAARVQTASVAERLAIKRAVYKVVDAIIDGIAWKRNVGDFEEATRAQMLGKRFGRGQVVLEKALIEAFPRYEELALADVDKQLMDAQGDDLAPRDEAATVSDPYRTIDYAPDGGAEGESGMTVESVVLIEALALYNEAVELYRRGSADESHELEALRQSFKARYRDLVPVDTGELAELSKASVDSFARNGVLARFWAFLRKDLSGGI